MSTVRRWKKIYPHINESTVSGFKDQIGKKKSSKTGITSKLPERPCLFRNKIDPLIQKYLKVTAKALTKRYPLSEKNHLKLGKSCAQSLFYYLGFVRRIIQSGFQ